MSLPAWAIRGVHSIIDIALGVRARSVLNPEPRAGPPIDAVLPDLRRFLATGKVHYASLREAAEYRRFCDAVAALHHTEPPAPVEAARAWWINLYNALIIHAVIAFRIQRSVLWEDLGFFRRAAYVVAGRRVSADDIEHGILRNNRRHPFLLLQQFPQGDDRCLWSLPLDPRIHFALVCAANSCPAINLYRPEHLDPQLDAAAAAFINGGGVTVDANAGIVSISRIFKWYHGDFGGRAGVLEFITRYLRDEQSRAVLERPGVRIRYQRYDWALNRHALRQ